VASSLALGLALLVAGFWGSRGRAHKYSSTSLEPPNPLPLAPESLLPAPEPLALHTLYEEAPPSRHVSNMPAWWARWRLRASSGPGEEGLEVQRRLSVLSVQSPLCRNGHKWTSFPQSAEEDSDGHIQQSLAI